MTLAQRVRRIELLIATIVNTLMMAERKLAAKKRRRRRTR
jgi:hypothetical protein